jgi:hypothetical protein
MAAVVCEYNGRQRSGFISSRSAYLQSLPVFFFYPSCYVISSRFQDTHCAFLQFRIAAIQRGTSNGEAIKIATEWYGALHCPDSLRSPHVSRNALPFVGFSLLIKIATEWYGALHCPFNSGAAGSRWNLFVPTCNLLVLYSQLKTCLQL